MMSTATSHKTSSAGRPEKDPNDVTRLSIYQLIMTPINFVTFLVSLWLVDYHYHQQREYESAARQGGHHDSRLPAWLHRLVYYKPQQPYCWAGPANGSVSSSGNISNNNNNSNGGSGWYYHSKQKKLMRLHATEAFEMRKPVLVALGLVTAFVLVAGLWTTGCAVAWLSRYVSTAGGVAGLSLRA